MFNEIVKKVNWNNETLELSTGKIARQATGAVMVKMGNSVVQCSVVSATKPKEGVSFFPLTVHYQEKNYAIGKIPGGFFKREGRPTEKEVLVSRLIDRPIRPLFDKSFFNETQILCTVHSFDHEHNTDILALIGASAALAISGVPFLDIISAVRVGLINNEFVLNPSVDQMSDTDLDLIVAGTKDSIMMVESEANFLSEEQMIDAIKFGHNQMQPVISLIEELKAEVAPEAWKTEPIYPAELKEEISNAYDNDILDAFSITTKPDRYDAIHQIKQDIYSKFSEQYTELQLHLALSAVQSRLLRSRLLSTDKRIDGRNPDEIRPIECEVSIFPLTHGSALFTRGETQSIVTTTLGTKSDEQIIDGLERDYKEKFLLDYIFPGYSVGETTPLRPPSRREIGHGKLAWRALKSSLPHEKDFPYTIRVVSEISESNGSSSMATVCGASMSMMNAGVSLKAPIAGIAMGLIKETDKTLVLSDIIADEDHLGDMDFKVAGSRDKITALQMDIKVTGIDFDILQTALQQAHAGRNHILDQMAKAIDAHGEMSSNAPMIFTLQIEKNKIRDVIGPGGKMIREISDSTESKIDISDDGIVTISAVGKENLDKAIEQVKSVAIEPEIGNVFQGKVMKILDAGAFVNYSPNRDGFLHISEISQERIRAVEDVLEEGQTVTVKLIGFERGKAQLTIKNAHLEGVVAKKRVNKPYNNKENNNNKDYKPRR